MSVALGLVVGSLAICFINVADEVNKKQLKSYSESFYF